MVTSQNGWVANDPTRTKIWTVGNGRQVRLEKRDAGFLLKDFADWFDKNVEDLDAGQLDDWGYAERTIRGSDTTVSNHASGTAIDLNATRHPLGERGTFTAAQTAAIRARLRRYNGCIRWGGDYSGRADEMHFEINQTPAAVAQVAARLRLPPTKVTQARALLAQARPLLVAARDTAGPVRKAAIRAGLIALSATESALPKR